MKPQTRIRTPPTPITTSTSSSAQRQWISTYTILDRMTGEFNNRLKGLKLLMQPQTVASTLPESDSVESDQMAKMPFKDAIAFAASIISSRDQLRKQQHYWH